MTRNLLDHIYMGQVNKDSMLDDKTNLFRDTLSMYCANLMCKDEEINYPCNELIRDYQRYQDKYHITRYQAVDNIRVMHEYLCENDGDNISNEVIERFLKDE